MKKRLLQTALATLYLPLALLAQQPVAFRLDAAHPTATIQPTMWGIFFEDINFAADGGIYAELVKNRSFEFPTPMMGWKEMSKDQDGSNVLILNRNEVNQANARFARFTIKSSGNYGISNEGFRGVGIRQGETYQFSVLAHPVSGNNITLKLQLVNSKGEPIGEGTLPLTGGTEWKRYTASIMATGTDAKGKLNIWFEGTGTVDMDMISLFPKETWKGRPGGMRKDLVQLLADLKPGFIRFPGGCIVEGRDLANRYQWKNTIGPLEERKLIMNRWNVEFPNRNAPDYYQSYGLGFYEYFQLAEDIGASPLPIINCGMACQFNSAEVVTTDKLDSFIQDALDLIEFANGHASTKWGRLRTDLGHPAPFNLKMMGVGNEQWGPQYIDRFRFFEKAIKARYPDVKLVNSTGTDPEGDRFNYLNDTLRKLNADILDEHYYRPPTWFFSHAARYDQYDRNGPKVFAGEYASHVPNTNGPEKNTWLAALSEAAYMTGLERNADIVGMASYAPLFAHVDAWQWAPNLIWFDNLRSYGTPSYYVQKLFSNNTGGKVAPLLRDDEAVEGKDSLYASAVLDTTAGEVVIKMVNASAISQNAQVALAGVRKPAITANTQVLQSINLAQTNTLDKPKDISPMEEKTKLRGNVLPLILPPYSFTIARVKAGF
jgi:alpha-L-arabinofuranosidase